jgi:hypothetical protein
MPSLLPINLILLHNRLQTGRSVVAVRFDAIFRVLTNFVHRDIRRAQDQPRVLQTRLLKEI